MLWRHVDAFVGNTNCILKYMLYAGRVYFTYKLLEKKYTIKQVVGW